MKRKTQAWLLVVIVWCLIVPTAFCFEFTDSAGTSVIVADSPERVVSLVPSITEIILRIGGGESVQGITYHSVLPPESAGKAIVGGFFSPDLDRVEALAPDVIFYAGLHTGVQERFGDSATLINLTPHSIEDSFAHIRLLGRMFGKVPQAEAVIAEEQRQLAAIADKVGKIPADDRQRVMRLMGRDRIMTPGDDSFQNEFIRAAGAIAPQLQKQGSVVGVTLDEWRNFNPQVLYGCAGDRNLVELLHRPGWNEVEAVRNERILFFPCELTCRAATHSGSFVSWLAAGIYREQFSRLEDGVLPEQVVDRRPLEIDLPYIRKAEKRYSDIRDFRNKTLVLELAGPMKVVSTLEGFRDNITTVANHYFPPPSWGLGHDQELADLRQRTLKVLGLQHETTAMLFTGADMDNLAIARQSYRDMTVYALVTAGVQSNAVRMSADTGSYYEPTGSSTAEKPGTINILLLTNMQLSPRAMTRALISITEGKTAALADLDIRSSYTPDINRATGTGTDNIIVVEGEGVAIDASGGHTKMGELMARAVYEGVQQAIHLQNGLVAERSVFQRLRERKIIIWDIAGKAVPESDSLVIRKELERLLLQPQYADFLKASLTLSDAYERGLIADTADFDLWCGAVAREIAGTEVSLKEYAGLAELPVVIGKALAALLSGLEAKP